MLLKNDRDVPIPIREFGNEEVKSGDGMMMTMMIVDVWRKTCLLPAKLSPLNANIMQFVPFSGSARITGVL